MLNRFFKISDHGSTVSTEITAGLTTFAALAYILGVFMMQGIARLDLRDLTQAVPAILMMVLMPLTFSISEGLAIGFVAYVLFMIGIGRARRVHWMGYVLTAFFLAHFFYRAS